MLVDFHVSNGFPKELEMFVAGTVLQVNKKPIFYDIIEKVTAIPFRHWILDGSFFTFVFCKIVPLFVKVAKCVFYVIKSCFYLAAI